MKSIIESTTLSTDGIRASIATEYAQSSLVRLHVVSDVKKAKLLTSDDIKEIGNIVLEGQKMPQKAERLGCEISETPSFCACSSPKNTRLFSTFLHHSNVNFADCTFYRSLYCFYRVLILSQGKLRSDRVFPNRFQNRVQNRSNLRVNCHLQFFPSKLVTMNCRRSMLSTDTPFVHWKMVLPHPGPL
jgi:hypothetical protein